MRAAYQRPRSQHGRQAVTLPTSSPQPTRKIFNCIVDDTALVAGVKKTTRNGIRQWVKSGQIRLFVPLHALEQLSRQKNGTSRHAEDVRETLQWLDDATSRYPNAVTLQGGDQYYATWTEVEQFAVPRTLFSEYDHIVDAEVDFESSGLSLAQDGVQELGLEERESRDPNEVTALIRPVSHSSTESATFPDRPKTSLKESANGNTSPMKSKRDGSHAISQDHSSVPLRLQPLFNYMLWRVHQELDPVAALEAFIFLCNDPAKTNYARGFDIRYKRLEQLRDAIIREDRDTRNRQNISSRDESILSLPMSTNVDHDGEHESDEEVLFRPPSRALDPSSPRSPPAKVMDPHAFNRSGNVAVLEPPQSPRVSESGASLQRFEGPRSPRGTYRAAGRGGRGRKTAAGSIRGASKSDARTSQQAGQIDPDSFSRPRGSGSTRGGGRKLWVPT